MTSATNDNAHRRKLVRFRLTATTRTGKKTTIQSRSAVQWEIVAVYSNGVEVTYPKPFSALHLAVTKSAQLLAAAHEMGVHS